MPHVRTSVVSDKGYLHEQIAQLYLHFPEQAREPPSVLRGFTEVDLHPGESKTVSITLLRYDLSMWDVPSQSWMRAEGA